MIWVVQPNGGFQKLGDPHSWMVCNGRYMKIPLRWMMIGGTPISGNPGNPQIIQWLRFHSLDDEMCGSSQLTVSGAANGLEGVQFRRCQGVRQRVMIRSTDDGKLVARMVMQDGLINCVSMVHHSWDLGHLITCPPVNSQFAMENDLPIKDCDFI